MSNTWFEFEATYEGLGRAEFTDPPGCIEGPTKVHFLESGDVTSEMTAPAIRSERPLRFGWGEFLSGEKPKDDGKIATMGFSGLKNPCKSLEVRTHNGLFRSSSLTIAGFSSDLLTLKSLRFHPWRSEFMRSQEPQASCYWVLPLWNFRSDFRGYRTPVDGHPLRFQSPPLPSTAEDPNKRLMEDLAAASGNRVIWFPFNGGAAYIEPLPDYEDRIRALEEGRAQRLVTAVMVGDLGTIHPILESFQRDFPVQLLTLIELATGVEVGTPWIEFRDSTGSLCKRLHMHLGDPYFHESRQPICQASSKGVGYLIAKGLESPHLREDCFVVAARNLIRAGWTTSIDEGLRHLVVALETLCERFGHKATDLLAELSPEKRSEVKRSLADTRMRLIDRWSSISGLTTKDRGVLERVAERVETISASKENSFGLSVVKLIEQFGFPDCDVVEPYFLTKRPGRGQGFCSALSWARGKVLHGGYFTFTAGRDDVDEIFALNRHLHDLILRILLKMLGYDDLYQPTVITMRAAEPVDWVKRDFQPSRLGYSSRGDNPD